MTNAPRVKALIERVMARYPGMSNSASARYFEAVHQELGPLARELECQTIAMQARIQELETWQRTICELLAPEGDEVRPDDAHDVVSCLRESLATSEALNAKLLSAPSEPTRQLMMDAVAQALGDAYDCTRVWGAWSYGTMGPDDFHLVVDDAARVAEITDAAITAMQGEKDIKRWQEAVIPRHAAPQEKS